MRYHPRPLFLIAMSALLLLSLSACQKKEAVQRYALDEAAPSQGLVAEKAESREAPASGAPGAPPLPGQGVERRLIQRHDLSVEVRDVAGAFAVARALAGESGGYVVESSLYRMADGRLSARLVLRLPPRKVAGALERFKGLGKPLGESSNAEDITDRYYDLEARLRNSKASEVRLLDLLSRRAAKLSEVLEVERELTRVRGDVESMEAAKRGWDVLTRTEQVTLELTEPPRAAPAFRAVWFPLKTAFGEALEGFARSVHALVVFLGVVLPWALILGAVLYLIFRRVERGRKGKGKGKE